MKTLNMELVGFFGLEEYKKGLVRSGFLIRF